MESQLGDPDATPGPVDLPNGKRRWRRNRVACDSCHTRRVRCDRAFPCSRCLRSDTLCEFTRERRKRGRIARAKLVNGSSTGPGEGPPPHFVPRTESHDQKPPGLPALSPQQQHSSPESTFQHRSPTTNDISLSAPSVDGPHSAVDSSRSQRPALAPGPGPRRKGTPRKNGCRLHIYRPSPMIFWGVYMGVMDHCPGCGIFGLLGIWQAIILPNAIRRSRWYLRNLMQDRECPPANGRN